MRKSIAVLLLSIAAVSVGNLALLTWSADAPAAQAATSASNELLSQGIHRLEEERYADAIRLFEQAVTANPKNAEAFSYLGRGYDEAGIELRAYKYYSIALEIDPNDVKALSWSGQVDVDYRRTDLARQKLARLERICGTSCPEYQDLKLALDNAKTGN